MDNHRTPTIRVENMDHAENKDVVVEEDESALDAEIEASIQNIRAENSTPAKPAEKIEEEVETPSTEPKTEPASPAPDAAEPAEDDPQKAIVESFHAPVKGKFESEESYQKRVELADLVKARKAATTPEEKAKLSERVDQTRRELSTLDRKDKITHPNGEAAPKPDDSEDEGVVADRTRLKAIGGATKEDILEVVKQERFEAEVKGNLKSFVERHPELADEDRREVFFDFVDANYNWQNKSGKELMTVLELARESMFKPSETISARVLKGADVAGKVNAMQFPGGTIAKPGLTAEQQKSITELKGAGMSEEKALELISED